MCGTYVTDQGCRASDDGHYNVKITWDIFGTDVGSFTRNYQLYDALDTACTGTMVGSYLIQGTYALHGPSDCGGTCVVSICNMQRAECRV